MHDYDYARDQLPYDLLNSDAFSGGSGGYIPGGLGRDIVRSSTQLGTSPQVTKMMEAWIKSCDTIAQELLEEGNVDGMYGWLLRAQSALKAIDLDLKEIEPRRRPDHLFGLAFGKVSSVAWTGSGEATEEATQHIEALATVTLEDEADFRGSLSEEMRKQGIARPWMGIPWPALGRQRVDVVHITWLVAKPNRVRKGVGGELVHAIVAWAKRERRLVTVYAPSKQISEYYEKLGFKDMRGSSRMVYCGDREADIPNDQAAAQSEGPVLLDLLKKHIS